MSKPSSQINSEARKVLNVADEHVHEWVHLRTDEDWWDGDETEVYGCSCDERDYRYIPR